MPTAQDRATATTGATAPNERPTAAVGGPVRRTAEFATCGGHGSAAGSETDARAAGRAAFDADWLVGFAGPAPGRVLGPRAA